MRQSAAAARRFRARDFDVAVAAREDREAARWVNAIRFPAGGAMARVLEAQRRRGTLLHFAIVDHLDGGYLGEILVSCAARKPLSSTSARSPM